MHSLDALIGESASMQALRANARRFLERQREARRIPSVLLLGETGTGKGLLAKLLHRGSPRADGPFIEVNCAAIPDTLLEAELFGFERGAFTEARHAKAGLFQAADHGTIFLDEIALLNEGLQGKLLKILEDRAVRRLGSTRTEPVDVWVIAATSEDLLTKTRDGSFREDLYHRLAVITLTLPPLRERGNDVVLLADVFLKAACADYDLPQKSLDPAAYRALTRYEWPGNIRELGNAMERIALLCETSIVGPEHLGLPATELDGDTEPTAEGGLDARRRDEILAVLTQTKWNITRAAARLLITRNTLRARMRRYGLRDPRASAQPEPAAPAGRSPSGERRVARAGFLWESRRLTALRAEVAAVYGDAFSGVSRQAFETVVDKVRSFGGRIEEVTPTAVMAVFGLTPVDEGPRRAANAALAIQRALRGPPTNVGLCIHFAEMLVARIGEEFEIDTHSKREVWAVLDSLGHHTRHDAIIVSRAAAALLDRRFEVAPADGPDSLGGSAYRLLGPEHRGLTADGRAAPFTGRHYELDVLRRRLTAVVGGEGQAVGLVGEPGIGKSRLLHEFRGTLDAGYRVVEAECAAYGRGFPYLPVTALLCSVLGVNDGDDPRVVRDTVTKHSSLRGPRVADGVAPMLALLHCLPEDDPLFSLTPAQRRRRTVEALRQLLMAEAERQPLIVIVEDLQWIDPESEAILAGLIDGIAQAQMLVLASYRPEYAAPWKRSASVTELALEPLSPPSVHAVLGSLLGADAGLDSLKELIVRRTEGNPFFVEETVRSLIEARIVVGARGSYEIAESINAIEVPATVQAVLAARIDRLGGDERRLLQAASVIGRHVPLSLLSAIVDIRDAERENALTALQRANFLYEPRDASEPTRVFTHALTCEVAHASLLPEEGRRLHASLVTALESRYSAEERQDHIDTVANHAYAAELWDKACQYYRKAAQRAMNRSAYRAAVFCLERALAAGDKLSPTREVLAIAVDLRFELRNALWALGELSRGLRYLREAQPLAEALGDRRRLATLFARTSFNVLILGDNSGALEAGERALALAKDVDDAAIQVDAQQYLGLLHNSLGNFDRAIRYLESNVRSVATRGAQGRFVDYYAVHSRTWLVWSLCEIGDVERAALLAQEAASIADASMQSYNVVASRWAIGMVHLATGQPHLAVHELESALATCQAADVAIWMRPTVALLGRALALSGRLAQALPLLEQAMRPDENHVAVTAWETYLAEGYMLAGRLEEAASRAEHAANLACSLREQGFLAHAYEQLAAIAENRGSPAEARTYYERALALAQACNMRPLITKCERNLATLSTA